MNRRRGVGVGRTSGRAGGDNRLKEATQRKADELKAVNLQSAIDTLEKLEIKLSTFAKEHQNDIINDPLFRHNFVQMCTPLGVDILSSKKTVLGTILGMGDFYYDLAVKIIEICVRHRSKNGGLMSINEIHSILINRRTKLGTVSSSTTTTTNSSKSKTNKKAFTTTTNKFNTNNISTADIIIAIQKLSSLGGGYRTIEVGMTTMVVSVPTEFDNDHMTIITIANAEQGHCSNSDNNCNDSTIGLGITVQQIQNHTGWTQQRIERTIELLLQEGMIWADTYQNSTYYWFTSIWHDNNNSTS